MKMLVVRLLLVISIPFFLVALVCVAAIHGTQEAAEETRREFWALVSQLRRGWGGAWGNYRVRFETAAGPAVGVIVVARSPMEAIQKARVSFERYPPGSPIVAVDSVEPVDG